MDVGDVAVIEDDGSILTPANLFDLRNSSVRFDPSGSQSYQLVSAVGNIDATAGTRLTLGDDAAAAVDLGFPFPFYGNTHSVINVNSDGNLTFNAADIDSADRDLARFSSGPPRIGPFFADLDPSRSGSVVVRIEADGVIFIWNDIPEYAEGAITRFNTFAAKLFRNGSIQFLFGARIDSTQAIVGISPGYGEGGVEAIDIAGSLPTPPLRGTIAEVFSNSEILSETNISRRFLETHPDRFDLITVFLGFPFDLGDGAYAYELNIKNEIEGIGLAIKDESRYYGSQGRLRSFLNMGTLSRYPNDPSRVFLGTNSTMGIMGQESGHRWLAFTPFRDGDNNSKAILGRAEAHWSFFFNSEASVMEGNKIQDLGPSRTSDRFVTIAATNTYSLFDQYIMGLVDKESVPPSFLVANPTGSFRLPSSAPQTGIVFGGTRKDISIDSIIASNGIRKPSVWQSPKVFRQAFIYLTRQATAAEPDQIQKVQNIRDAWVRFFNEQTQGRGWVITDLQDTPGTSSSSLLFPYFQGNATRYTGIALVNYGDSPADVLLTAIDNAGSVLSSPSRITNPRMITLAPGAQVAMLAEEIHGLDLQDPRNGWIRAESTSRKVAGLFLDGDIEQSFLSGAVAASSTATTLYFSRSQLASSISPGNSYRNLINLVNPGASGVQATLQHIGQDGQVLETSSRFIRPSGRLSEDLTTIFPSAIPPRHGGYVKIFSDAGILGYQSIDTGSTFFALPAQPGSTASRLYSAQFASGQAGNALYFTEINLINTSNQTRTVNIQLLGNDGQPVSGISNPVRRILDPGAQLRARGESLLGLPDASLGPPVVEGSLVIIADGEGIIGDIAFGEPTKGRYIASLPLDAKPLTYLVLSQVAQGSAGSAKPYFTGIAMFNPGANAVDVTIEVYSERGNLTGRATLSLGPGSRISKTLPELVPSIREQVKGHIRIRSNGSGICACELLGDQGLTFLAAVVPQVAN